jgi:drug/metabolite transporter (DMT)-like permease
LGGLGTACIGLVAGERAPSSFPIAACIAWFYLVVFGSMIAFSAYAYLVRNAPTPLAMSYAYVNPVLAVLLGAVAGGELVGPSVLVAGALVTCGVVLIVRARH